MASPPKSPEEAEFLKAIRLLYVEDSDDIRRQLTQFLRRRVGELILATNGQEGLEAFREHKPDVVITDVLMPVMNGLDMAAAIRQEAPDTPIIITTAFNDVAYLLKAIELGVDRYVIKPIDTSVLISSILHVARHLEQKRAIETHTRFARFVLDMHPNCLAITRDDELDFLNVTMLSFLGFTSLPEFFQHHDDIGEFFTDGFEGAWTTWLREHPPEQHIVHIRSASGAPHAFVVREAAFSELNRRVYSFTDVTRIEKEKDSLALQATHDALTGIFNRQAFNRTLEVEIQRAQRYGQPLALIMFDLDYFKAVNDTWGHAVGDKVLCAIVQLVASNTRDSDIFARWGGEEFMILAPNTTIANALVLAEKLRVILESSRLEKVEQITCSFGVTELLPTDTEASFTQRADEALYQAKGGGRNRVVRAP